MRLIDNDRALTRMARAGCAARGVVYTAIGVLAIQLARGEGGAAVGPRDALREMADAPFGRVALAVIAVGLAAFAAWRLIDGARDVEGRGSGWKGLAMRAGYVGSAAIHAGWALLAAGLAIGHDHGAGGDAPAQGWSALALAQPFGRWLLGAVALGLLVAGVGEVVIAWRGRFLREADLGDLPLPAARLVRSLGAIGTGARGVSWGVIAVCLAVAAREYDAQRARNLGGALGEILAQPWGEWLLGGIAIGLLAFGLYHLVLGRVFVIRRG